MNFSVIVMQSWFLLSFLYVIGPAKTGHICTNYTHLENGTFLGNGL